MNKMKQEREERIQKAKKFIIDEYIMKGYTLKKTKEYFAEAFEAYTMKKKQI